MVARVGEAIRASDFLGAGSRWAAAIPKELRDLVRRMAEENPVWGQERIARALLLKLGLRVSPRPTLGRPRGGQRWSTFLRNHARGVIACDFLVAVTSTFRVLYVLFVIEHRSRRLIHFNVTAHPTAQWTRQQLREAVGIRGAIRVPAARSRQYLLD